MGAVACGRLVEDPIRTIDVASHPPHPQSQHQHHHQHQHDKSSPDTRISKHSQGSTYRVETRTKRGSSSSIPTPTPASPPSAADAPTSAQSDTVKTTTTETAPPKPTTRTHRQTKSLYLSDRERSTRSALSVPVSPMASPENRVRSLTMRAEPRTERMTSPRTALALMRMSSPRSSIGSDPSSMFSIYMSDSGQASPLMIASLNASPIASPVSIHRRLTPSSCHPVPETQVAGTLLIDTSRDTPILHTDPEPVTVVASPENALDLMSMNLDVDIDSILVEGESPFFS